MLASRTMSLRAALQQLLGSAAATQGDDDRPLNITFDEKCPLNVSFEEGQMTISLCGQGYESGGKRYSAMDIELALHPERAGDGWWLVQSRPPQVMLPISADGRRPKLGLRDYALRRILTNVLERDVPRRMELKVANLPSPLDRLGPLTACEVLVGDGWFCLATKPDTQAVAN
jgi:hypothetical protein